jgi:CarboxypepD_reg-like domain
MLFINNIAISQIIIVDSINNKPINSVNIQYSQNKGLTTNEDGYFELPENQIIDTLYISHISYKSKNIYFSNLKENDTIFLTPSIINLDEIVLNRFKVKDTIIKAINNIDKNYLNIPYNLYGFFRQSLEENSKGVEMIEVDFISFINNNKTNTKIINAKRTDNYSEFGMETYGGVALEIQDGDFVRRKSYFLDIEKINNYLFEYKGQINYQDLDVYKISFEPKEKNNLQFIRKGILYIDSKSLAFVELRYSFDKVKLSKIINLSTKNKSRNKPLYTLTGVENTIKYRRISNKKWALSYINLVNLRNGVFKKRENQYKLTSKLIINNIKTNNVIPVKNNYDLSKDFSKAVKKYDNLKKWDDNYKLSLSKREIKILNDINEKK